MKLHCEICALYDPSTGHFRIGPHTEIATIGKISLPLDASMFLSPQPERGLPPPWMPGVEWDSMKCPRGGHNIFVMDGKRAEQAMKDGGPNIVLTDTGWYDIEKPVEDPAEDPVELKMIKMKQAGFSNTKIGKKFGMPPATVVRRINKFKRELKRGENGDEKQTEKKGQDSKSENAKSCLS